MNNMPKRKDGDECFGLDHRDYIKYLQDFFKSYYVDYFEENKHRYSDGEFELSGQLWKNQFEIQGGGQCIILRADGTWDLEDTTGG